MIVTTVVPEGIVMAVDSSIITFKMMDMINFQKGNIQEAIKNTFSCTCAHEKDNIIGSKIITRSAYKLHVVKGDKIAIADGNQRNINNDSIAPYINYFCNNNYYDDPKSCAIALFNYLKEISPSIKAEYHVCGYTASGKDIPHPDFWYVDVTQNKVFNALGNEKYGISFSGANEYFSQYIPLINKNIVSFSLQDAVDISLFAIDMSIKLERFIDRDEHITPPVDLLVIEAAGIKWIQQKTLKTGS